MQYGPIHMPISNLDYYLSSSLNSLDLMIAFEDLNEAVFLPRIFEATSRAVTCRCVVSQKPSSRNISQQALSSEPDAGKTEALVREAGWEVKSTGQASSTSFLVVDRREAFLFETRTPGWDGRQRVFRVIDSPKVAAFKRHFDHTWQTDGEFRPLYEELVASTIPEVGNHLVSISSKRWDQLLKYFSRHPKAMHELSPRGFEEFVAELLERDGMEIKLTSPSRDGGRDIIASLKSHLGIHLYLVECKRYSHHRKVGVEYIRGLYGVVEAERASGGVLVTTSAFTRGAIEFSESLRNRMSLIDHNKLKDWLGRLQGSVSSQTI